MPAVVNGMYHQLRPGIRVLLNSAKPEMGYLALEAALPVGIYQMYPDPFETYIAYVTTDEKYRLNCRLRWVRLRNTMKTATPPPPKSVTSNRCPAVLTVGSRTIGPWWRNGKFLGGMSLVVRESDITGPGFRTASFWKPVKWT